MPRPQPRIGFAGRLALTFIFLFSYAALTSLALNCALFAPSAPDAREAASLTLLRRIDCLPSLWQNQGFSFEMRDLGVG